MIIYNDVFDSVIQFNFASSASNHTEAGNRFIKYSKKTEHDTDQAPPLQSTRKSPDCLLHEARPIFLVYLCQVAIVASQAANASTGAVALQSEGSSLIRRPRGSKQQSQTSSCAWQTCFECSDHRLVC